MEDKKEKIRTLEEGKSDSKEVMWRRKCKGGKKKRRTRWRKKREKRREYKGIRTQKEGQTSKISNVEEKMLRRKEEELNKVEEEEKRRENKKIMTGKEGKTNKRSNMEVKE